MILDDCFNFLNSDEGLPENWLSKYDFSEKNKDNSIKEIIGRINLCINTIFEKLNISILAGEIFYEMNYQDKLDELTSMISNIQVGIEVDDNDITLELNNIFHNSFIEPFFLAKKSILRLNHSFNKKLSNQGGKWLFVAEKITNNSSDLIDNSNFKDQITVLQTNIKIASIDIDLSIDEKILSDLILFKKVLEEIEFEYKYLSLIKDKCNFLIKKVLFRIKQDNKYSYLYAIDYQDKELTFDDVKPGKFSYFDNITKKHYSSKDECYTKGEIDLIKEKLRKKESLTYIEIHQLTKVFKDQNNNHKQVAEILSLFNSKYDVEIVQEDLSLFNKQSLYTMKNYMLNNEFSIFLEKKKLQFQDIEDKLDNIRQNQLDTGVKNYFPFLKCCNYIDTVLNDEFKKKELNFSFLNELLNKFKQILKEAYECLEWCKDRNFLAFQLPSYECNYFIQEDNLNLFLSSSFVLPINFEKVQLELNELKRKEGKYLTLIEVQENLEGQKKTIIKLRESVDKADRRSIEILGIFSAIVLFASGSIQIFSIENLTMSDALKFMLAFSYSLVLFIFLIWVITRENIKSLSKVHVGFFIGLVASTLIALTFVINSDNKNAKKKANENKQLVKEKVIKTNVAKAIK
jgi:hypothetical protein